MPKQGEIEYVANMATVLGVSRQEVEHFLLYKPYSVPSRRGCYLIDLGQIFRLLPEPPARLLDVGCGTGWTSKMFALAGFDVVGLDISADMIELARTNCRGAGSVDFLVRDYEMAIDCGTFQCAVIYDALHHAVDEHRIVKNVFDSLEPGGVFITAEPGRGHADHPDTRREAEKWGTTEKDMPFAHQKALMVAAGFKDVRQYIRLSEIPLIPLDETDGSQDQQISAVLYHTRDVGFTSICVARR